jgi:hypothetical protein
MSQLEHEFRLFLNKNPEIEKCYSSDLINRRSLVRYLIRHGFAKASQFDALIAMVRRFRFKEGNEIGMDMFKDIRMTLKDKIVILDFDKKRDLLNDIKETISIPDYEKGDTIKIVIGTASVKIFIDNKNQHKLKELIRRHRPAVVRNVCELSLLFPESAIDSRGIISTITSEFACNDIIITELLTATPELLIYVDEKYAVRSFEIIKGLH